jgi:hypothetical protein
MLPEALSHIHCRWSSCRISIRLTVRQSVRLGVEPQMVVNCSTVAVLSCSCALSEERSGLFFSVVVQSLCQYEHEFLHFECFT